MNQLEKFVNKLLEKVSSLPYSVDDPDLSIEDYDAMMESIFVELRDKRTKKTDAFGNKTYADVWDNISDLELDHFKEKWLRLSPEQRYQYFKEQWSTHESSYLHRKLYMYDGEGCNTDGCIPDCRYFPEEGRTENSDVESWYEDYRKIRGEEYRRRREAACCHGIHFMIFPPHTERRWYG